MEVFLESYNLLFLATYKKREIQEERGKLKRNFGFNL